MNKDSVRFTDANKECYDKLMKENLMEEKERTLFEFKIKLNTLLWEMSPGGATISELEDIAAPAANKFGDLMDKYENRAE